MQVNHHVNPHYYRLFGITSDGVVIGFPAYMKKGGSAATRAMFAEKNHCVATCLVDKRRVLDEGGEPVSAAREKLTNMLRIISRSNQPNAVYA